MRAKMILQQHYPVEFPDWKKRISLSDLSNVYEIQKRYIEYLDRNEKSSLTFCHAFQKQNQTSYELQKIPYDEKKSATLTGFAGEARYIINEFTKHSANCKVFQGFAMQEIKRGLPVGAAWGMKAGI